MTVTIYKSTDGSAPSLTGQAGSLTTLLDAVLVNGYGSKSAAGWTIDKTGTNKRVYKQPAGSNQFFLRVADDAGTTYARIVAGETCTDIDTLGAYFPTEVQFSGGLYAYKSTTADGTARAWICISNGKFFVLIVNSASHATWDTAVSWAFGDITSYKSADAYHTIIIGGNGTGATNNNLVAQTQFVLTDFSNCPGHYMARSQSQSGTSVQVGKVLDGVKGGSTLYGMGRGVLPYPHAPDSKLVLSPAWIYESTPCIRGILPGIWSPCHAYTLLTNADTFSGAGDLAGKTFEICHLYAYGATPGCIAFETSNTW